MHVSSGVRSAPFRLSLMLQLQDMLSHSVKPLFDAFTEKRILLIRQRRVDLHPVLRLQSLDRGRKEITLFRGDMATFVHDEVANHVIDGVPQDAPIPQHTLDRLHNSAQTFGTLPMLGREIANICSSGRIARSQLLEYNFLLRMMVNLWIDLEIANNRPDNLVVRPLSPLKNAQLLLKNEEQLFDVAMFSAQ
jgi:hypothetical protein